ncbi:MAG TPA: hypothetical protein VGK73_13515 [Polyangiaceae bacterium]
MGADLEDPERFAIPSGGTGAATAGAGAGGGAPGGAGASMAPEIPGVTCQWRTALTQSCARSSCHGRSGDQYAMLNLVPDATLFQRLKDVPATLLDVEDCDPGPDFVSCTEPSTGCMPFVGKKLIDSLNPDDSFLLIKMTATDCGNQMPAAPGNSSTVGWNDERKVCLEEMVRGIARMDL